MEKQSKFKSLVSNTGKTAKGLFDKAVQSIDQNDDGKFDMTDVTSIAGAVGDSIKKGAQTIKENSEEKARLAAEKARINELNTLQPIFAQTIDAADFLMPKFIRVTDRSKKYVESEVCQGSVGYTSNEKELRVVNIFKDSLNAFGLTFYPDIDSEFYYIDPTDRDRYIALDEYFSYLKIARINELQKIAQDLGAKYFKVTYKEEEEYSSEKKLRANINAQKIAKADLDHNHSEKKYSKTEIAAEMQFPGHAPIMPHLRYMQKDPSIQNLVAMRMDESAPLMNQKFMLKMSNSSGLKESDALKIDTVLKGIKFAGSFSVAKEVKNESRRYLEYEINF